MKRNCDNCKKEYNANERDLRRGWGLCCSKSCAAKKREKSKSTYNAENVLRNNKHRANYGRDRWGRKYGYPDFEAYETALFEIHEDGLSNVVLDICNLCGLRVDYCECGLDL